MAGAMYTGALVASTVVKSMSSAMPLANLPKKLALAGAIKIRRPFSQARCAPPRTARPCPTCR
jgi:hypothetical protein